jgi:hypothetical protein
MDEARRVIERLERIERLREDGGSRRAVLREVRKLLDDAEAWLAAEPSGTERARDALDRCRCTMEPEAEVVPAWEAR